MPTKARKSKSAKGSTKRAGKLSLHPMEFEDALAVMLNTPPPPKDEPKKATKHAAKKKTLN